MKLFKDQSIDLGKSKVNKTFWHYAIPSILAMIAQSTAGLVDSIFIGRYVGPDGLSAVTLVMPLVFLLNGVGMMIAIGGSTMAGIFKGENEIKKSNNYFNTTWLLLTIVGIGATVLVNILSSMIVHFWGSQGEAISMMSTYITTLSFFFLPFLLTFAFSYFLKLDGKPIVVVICMLAGMLVNISLDYLLLGVLQWGVRGAALATGISQLMPWLVLTYLLKFKSSWKFKLPKINKEILKNIFFNGSSELLNIAAVSIAGFIYNGIIVAKIGMGGIAAFAVAMQISQLATSIYYGFAESIQSPVSFNFGAGNLKRVKKFRKYSTIANFTAGIVLSIILVVWGQNLAGFFVKDQETIALAKVILYYYAVAFILSGVNITVATYYTAVNEPILSGLLAIIRGLIGTVAGVVILPALFGDNGIWGALIFTEIVTIIVVFVSLKKYPYGLKKALNLRKT